MAARHESGDTARDDPDTAQDCRGLITSVTVRVRALPATSEQRQYLFPDFAAGLAALHEAERLGLGL